MSVIVLGMMALYLIIASIGVLLVWKRTSRKLYRWLAVAIAVLLPSWDVVLSTVFFYAACPLFSKAEIYETAETEGIYYEGYLRSTVYVGISWYGHEVNRIGRTANEDIRRGYKYMEFKVTRQHGLDDKVSALPQPTIYRCTEDRQDPRHTWITHTQCSPVADIESKYVVKSDYCKYHLIGLSYVKIFERTTGRLMAEYRQIAKHPYAGDPFFPFFTWLNWDHGEFRGGTNTVSCPKESEFFTFQYRVLKLKK